MKYDPFLLRVSGKVTISVKAEAMQSSILCGKNAVFVPQKGRIDTIIKTLLVQVITILLIKKNRNIKCVQFWDFQTVCMQGPLTGYIRLKLTLFVDYVVLKLLSVEAMYILT